MNSPWKKWNDPKGLNLHFDTPIAIMQILQKNQMNQVEEDGDPHHGCTMEEVLKGLGFEDKDITASVKCTVRLLLDRMSRPSIGLLHCVNDAKEGVGQSSTRYCLGYEKIIDRHVKRFASLPDEQKSALCKGAKFDMDTPEPPNAHWVPDSELVQ